MWWGVLCLLCMSQGWGSVSVDAGLKDIYVSANEKTLIDLSSVFSGSWLNISVDDPSRQVSVEYLFHAHEVPWRSSATNSARFGQRSNEYVVLFWNRSIEVWRTAGSEPLKVREITIENEVEGAEIASFYESSLIVLWTKPSARVAREFYSAVLLDLHSLPVKLEGIISKPESTVKVCTSSYKLVVLTPQASSFGSSVAIYVLTNPLIINEEFFFPYPIVDCLCRDSLQILTPTEFYFAQGSRVSLERFQGGKALRLRETGDIRSIAIVTEKGLIFTISPLEAVFVPSGQYALGSVIDTTRFQVLVYHGSEWLYISFLQFNYQLRSFIIPVSMKERPSEIRDIAVVPKFGLLEAFLIMLVTDGGLASYCVDHSPLPRLRVAANTESFPFTIRACSYFDRDECASTQSTVHVADPSISLLGEPVTSAAVLRLPCAVSSLSPHCEYRLSDWFSGESIEYEVQSNDRNLSASVSRRLPVEEFSFELPQTDMRIGCSRYMSCNSSVIVLLGFDRIAIITIPSGETHEVNVELSVDFRACQVLGNTIVLYGTYKDEVGALFYSYYDRISKIDYKDLRSPPKLIVAGNMLIAISETDLIITYEYFNVGVVTVVQVGSPIRDVSFDELNMLVLVEGKVLHYRIFAGNWVFTHSIIIDSKELEIAFVPGGVLAYDSRTLSHYLVTADMTTELLHSEESHCSFLGLLKWDTAGLLACKEGVHRVQLFSAQWTVLSAGEVVAVQVVSNACFVVRCSGSQCSASLWTGVDRNEAILSVNASFSEVQFSSKSIALSLSVSSASSPPTSLSLVLDFTNPGAFIVPRQQHRSFTVDWDQEAELPISDLFIGNEIGVSVDSAAIAAGITVLPACESALTIPVLCASGRYIVATETKMIVCYLVTTLSVYQYECENDKCKTTLRGRYEPADFDIKQILSLGFICELGPWSLVFLIAGQFATQYEETEELMILPFRKVDFKLHSQIFRFSHHNSRNFITVKENDGRWHLCFYKYTFRHFIIMREGAEASIVEATLAGSFPLGIESIARSETDHSLLSILTYDQALYSYSLADSSVRKLNCSVAPLSGYVLLNGKFLLHLEANTLTTYSLPACRSVKSINLLRDSINGKLVALTSTIVAISQDTTSSLIVDVSAPSDSAVICSLPRSEVLSSESYAVLRNRDSAEVLRFRTAKLRIPADSAQAQETVSEVNVTASNRYSGPVTLTLTLHRGRKAASTAVVVVCIVLLAAGSLGVLCFVLKVRKTAVNRRREIELKELTQSNTVSS